jgi:hypothetical protein
MKFKPQETLHTLTSDYMPLIFGWLGSNQIAQNTLCLTFFKPDFKIIVLRRIMQGL